MKRALAILSIFLMAATAAAKTTHGHKGQNTNSLVISTANLPNGAVSTPYSATVAASGGTAPYTFAVSPASFAPGLTFNTSSGAFSGTPTTQGVYTLSVTVTDSAGSPVSYSQPYSLAIAGLGVTLSPSSLDFGNQQQSTSSAPQTVTLTNSGTITTLNITSIVASTGYSRITTCGATLAAGASCTISVTFTPTIVGAQNGTITITDDAPGSPRTVPLTGTGTSTPSTTYFQDGFETGCVIASCSSTNYATDLGFFPAWTGLAYATGEIDPPTNQTTIKYAGSYAYLQRFFICGDSSNPACGAAHQDINRGLDKTLPPLTHFFVTGYVYFKTPESDATPNKIVQRKLIRLTDGPLGTPADTYEVLLQGWSGASGLPTNNSNLSLSCYCGTAGAFVTYWDLATIPYDTWTKVEEEIQLNTPGVSDGVYRLWVGSSTTPVYENTAIQLRNSKTTPIAYMRIGAQADRTTYFIVDEYRGWDDISVTSAFVP